MSRRWHELTAAGQPLNYNSIVDFIDQATATISDAAAREQQRWGTVPNFEGEVTDIKNWISQRMAWINNHIGGYTACENPALPSLAITRINYNPGESTDFPESDDQEFFAIKNTGSGTVSLTGIYLRELGVSYQFPAGSTIIAGETYYIAGNASVFQQKYGVAPFGEFQRTLSNSSQKLVLADGMGNIVDTVEYDDASPWPDADGNGMYLMLTDTALDNSLATSWAAVSDATLNTDTTTEAAQIILYPNPVSNILNIRAEESVDAYEVYNIYGKLLQHANSAGQKIQIDLGTYATGVYFIKLKTASGVATKKVVKQ